MLLDDARYVVTPLELLTQLLDPWLGGRPDGDLLHLVPKASWNRFPALRAGVSQRDPSQHQDCDRKAPEGDRPLDTKPSHCDARKGHCHCCADLRRSVCKRIILVFELGVVAIARAHTPIDLARRHLSTRAGPAARPGLTFAVTVESVPGL
jgi:hypothetical protein